jgi:hypothetical protein
MAEDREARLSEGEAVPELSVSPEKVCYIIMRAREFDAKVDAAEPDSDSTPEDGDEGDIFEDHADDPTLAELHAAIDDLNEDEVIDLIALAWLGRGDFTRDGWEEARALARERHRRHSSGYLIGMPALGDYLEEGLAALGYSCEGYEARL